MVRIIIHIFNAMYPKKKKKNMTPNPKIKKDMAPNPKIKGGFVVSSVQTKLEPLLFMHLLH